jgi:hypothetical protein
VKEESRLAPRPFKSPLNDPPRLILQPLRAPLSIQESSPAKCYQFEFAEGLPAHSLRPQLLALAASPSLKPGVPRFKFLLLSRSLTLVSL